MKKYLLVLLFFSLVAALMGGCSSILQEDGPQQGTMSGTGQEGSGSEPAMAAPPAGAEPEGSSAEPKDAGAEPESSSAESKDAGAEPESSGAEPENSNAGEADRTFPFYGTWEVKDYQIQVGTQYALSMEDMDAFRGVTIDYQSGSVALDGEKVTADSFVYKTDDTAYDYDGLTETYGANLGEWWNNISQVTHITIDSGNAFFGDQFFIVDSDTIWIYYEDVFFLAKRN